MSPVLRISLAAAAGAALLSAPAVTPAEAPAPGKFRMNLAY